MKKFFSNLLLFSVAGVLVAASEAQAGGPFHHKHAKAEKHAAYRASGAPWHQPYYNTTYGTPVALVVPPTSRMMTEWGWGVTQSTVTPIFHQFKRPYPGDDFSMDADLQPTPQFPSHTHQFGIYPVRAPWK